MALCLAAGQNSREFISFEIKQYLSGGDKETILNVRDNITAKASPKFGSETWVLKKREEQRLEAAQMNFLRHLLGTTKLDKKEESIY